jgi:hypothetical protein
VTEENAEDYELITNKNSTYPTHIYIPDGYVIHLLICFILFSEFTKLLYWFAINSVSADYFYLLTRFVFVLLTDTFIPNRLSVNSS